MVNTESLLEKAVNAYFPQLSYLKESRTESVGWQECLKECPGSTIFTVTQHALHTACLMSAAYLLTVPDLPAVHTSLATGLLLLYPPTLGTAMYSAVMVEDRVKLYRSLGRS